MTIVYHYSQPAERKTARAALMELQGARCGGCFSVAARLQVDHDHDTDWIRGLLCANCNTGEGHGGSAFAWDLYVEKPPASFLGRRDAMLDHWLECAGRAEAAALAGRQSEWSSGFIRMSRDLMERKWRKYQAWHWNGAGPRDLEFERWHAEDSELDERAQEAVRLAFTINIEPLRRFDFRERHIEGFLRELSFRFRRPFERDLWVAREQEIEMELAHITEPHQYAWDGVHVDDPERGRLSLRYCAHEGCGLTSDEHPRFIGKQSGERIRLIRERVSALLDERLAA